jgi:hypothetical protein
MLDFEQSAKKVPAPLMWPGGERAAGLRRAKRAGISVLVLA